MKKERPITDVWDMALDRVPELKRPTNIQNVRPFLEGLIACVETNANLWRSPNPYKKGTDHYTDWQKGWQYVINRSEKKPKFLKKCDAA